MLKSNRLVLRAIEEADLSLIAQWRSQPELYEFFYEWLPISLRQQKNWYEKQMLNQNEINLIIADRGTGNAIGTISIYNIDRRNRKAEWGRILINDPALRSVGLGSEALSLVIEYSFEHLNLNKLYCEVFEYNEAAKRLYSKLGFKPEGILRQHVYKAGKYENIVVMSMLGEEFYKIEEIHKILQKSRST